MHTFYLWRCADLTAQAAKALGKNGGGIVWFYRVLAGLNTDPSQPSYRNIIFKPQPTGDVTFASYSNETSYGRAGINWKQNARSFTVAVSVPVGSTAIVYMPASNANAVTESGEKLTGNSLVRFQGMEKGFAVYRVGSGTYAFDSPR